MNLFNLIDKYINISYRQTELTNKSDVISYYKESMMINLENNLKRLYGLIKSTIKESENTLLQKCKDELMLSISKAEQNIENSDQNLFKLEYYLDFYKYFLMELDNTLTTAKVV